MDPQELQTLCQHTQQTPFLIFAWTLLSAAILAVSLRLYIKFKHSRGIALDDYVALASTILATTGAAILTYWIHLGLGLHIRCLPPSRISSILLWSLVFRIANIVGICLIKTSVCLCVLCRLDRLQCLLRSFIWILIGVVSLVHIAQIVLAFLQRLPLNPAPGDLGSRCFRGRCFTHQQLHQAEYIGFALDAFTDLICAFVPWVLLRFLQLSSRRKVALRILIGLGSLTAACAVAKAIKLPSYFTLVTDPTWWAVEPARFSIAEHASGIILASLPSIEGLFTKKTEDNEIDDWRLRVDQETQREGSLNTQQRHNGAWKHALATPRIPGLQKKRLSISTFGMSEGEEGSRLTLVENRFTVVGQDQDRLICVNEEAGAGHERSQFVSRARKGKGNDNQEVVLGLGILGKNDPFGRAHSAKETRRPASSIYSVGRPSRPTTPKCLDVPCESSSLRAPAIPIPLLSAQPSISRTPSMTISTTQSPLLPEKPSTSVAPSTLSTQTPSSARSMPGSPARSKAPSIQTQLRYRASSRSRTASRPAAPSMPGTPSRSRAGTIRTPATLPVSKFRAELSEDVVAEIKQVGKFSDLGMERGKELPLPPQEAHVISIPTMERFSAIDTSY